MVSFYIALVIFPHFCYQVELHEAEKEVCHLRFRREVLEKEKELLAQFADHVAKVHSIKVRFTPSSSLLLTSVNMYVCIL